MADELIVVHNPSGRTVPAGIAACVLVMFFPPLALNAADSTEPTKAILGAAAMLVLAAWFVRSALLAVVEARFSHQSLTLRSVRESHYPLSQICQWYFAVPRALPTQSAPNTNALLFVRLEDGSRFRGEVTADEAARLASLLPHAAD